MLAERIYHETKRAEAWLGRLYVQGFRNLNFEYTFPKGILVFSGPNGAGKTNILEAVSLFSPGRGLRQAKLTHLRKWDTDSSEQWGVGAELHDDVQDKIKISTGMSTGDDIKRIVKIDGVPRSQSTLSDYIQIFWQTPQMDRLFLDGLSVRRRFFDKLIQIFYGDHGRRISHYAHCLRERSRLLREGRKIHPWLAILEEKMSQDSIAIIAMRQDFIEQLNIYSQDPSSPFPSTCIRMEGYVESLLEKHQTALKVEELLLAQLESDREKDAALGGARVGAHQTNFCVQKGADGTMVEQCSTGEQKALLLSLIMAVCRMHRSIKGRAPLLLLDEVVAHFDVKRRQQLFEEIVALNMQAWLTGTHHDPFSTLKNNAAFFRIDQGRLYEA